MRKIVWVARSERSRCSPPQSARLGELRGGRRRSGSPSAWRSSGSRVSPKTVTKGAVVTFTVSNKGTIGHDFRVGGKKTPLIAAGKKGTLQVTFARRVATRISARCRATRRPA